MRNISVFCAVVTAAFGIVACGGGGGYSTPTVATATATATPTAAATPTSSTSTPTPAATSTSTATTLSTATLLGSAGFVAPSGFTTYVLSGDTTTSLECTVASGCTGIWPPVAPPSGVALSTGFTTFTRPDNNQMQLAYKGSPLYTYAGDSGPAQTNGNGIVSYGGTWSITRP